MRASGGEEILIYGFILWLVLVLSVISNYIKHHPHSLLEMDIAKDGFIRIAERN